jgi:PfaD family protein
MVLAAIDRPCWVVRDATGLAVTTDPGSAPGADVLAVASPTAPPALGDPAFRRHHGVRYAYMTGAMANGIASVPMVVALARHGVLASFGAAGLPPDRIEASLTEIGRAVPPGRVACNLIHSPHEPAMERATVDACLRHGVRCVEASAFMGLNAQVVRYRVAGMARGPSGPVTRNRLIAKVSRAEVAARFLRPPPDALLRELVDAGAVTAEQADLARHVPLADDITVEADSGGHTDRRPLAVLLPEILATAEVVRRELGRPAAVRVGAAGGIGTPAAAAAAFALGAAYVVTGSVNQACVEADQSELTKRLLASARASDVAMAPSADMFELGANVQVLKRGTMFAARARLLDRVYRANGGIETIPTSERAELERRIFRRPLDEIWQDTRTYFADRDPDKVAHADNDPKMRMALVFRWYLGLSSTWSVGGRHDRVADFQVWCGPAMGAFNEWVAGTTLEPLERRHVTAIADQLMIGAAVHARVAQLRLAGVVVPTSCATYRPSPADADAT